MLTYVSLSSVKTLSSLHIYQRALCFFSCQVGMMLFGLTGTPESKFINIQDLLRQGSTSRPKF